MQFLLTPLPGTCVSGKIEATATHAHSNQATRKDTRYSIWNQKLLKDLADLKMHSPALALVPNRDHSLGRLKLFWYQKQVRLKRIKISLILEMFHGGSHGGSSLSRLQHWWPQTNADCICLQTAGWMGWASWVCLWQALPIHFHCLLHT